jgi:hypothetical protein
MMPPVVAFLLVLWQQPGAASAQATAVRHAAFDTTGAAVTDIADRVAGVKSTLELFRRAVFNSPDGEVLSTAEMLRARCHSLDSVAARAPRRICRTCAAQKVNAALTNYRLGMPEVARTGARCAVRVAQLTGRPDAAKRLRREVHGINDIVVGGLIPYERRLEQLRVALGSVPPGIVRQQPAPSRRP